MLAVSLLIPSSIPWDVLGRGVAQPVTALFLSGHGFGWHVGYISGLGAVAFLWIVPQRSGLLGGTFMDYASTLPVGRRVFTLTNDVLLLLADSVLLVPFIFGLIFSSRGTLIPAGLQALVLVALVFMLLLVQLTVLEKSWTAAAAAGVAMLLLAAALSVQVPLIRWVLASAALISSGWIVLVYCVIQI